MTDHDLRPDGKTGPWMRKPHNSTELGALAIDNRCGYCSKLIGKLLEVEQDGRPAIAFGTMSVREVERVVKEFITKGEYGAGL